MEDIKYKIVLPDNIEFFIEQQILNQIPTFIQLPKEQMSKNVITLDMDGKIFSQLITFLRYKLIDSKDTTFIDKQIEGMPINTLLEIILASKQLGLTEILGKSVERFRSILNNHSTDKIRELLNITCDFSEAEIKKNKIDFRWNEIDILKP